MKRRIIQIVVDSSDKGHLYCVCNDGTAWIMGNDGWHRIVDPPEAEDTDGEGPP